MAKDAIETSWLPLSALLSQVLVVFTIECDNEFERQMPHRTSNYGSTAGRGAGPWLVSMAMWWTCMRFVGPSGITVAELTRRARTGTNRSGMRRWKYISVEPDPADPRPKPPRSDSVIHATRAGRQAQEIWHPLTGVIEAQAGRAAALPDGAAPRRVSRRQLGYALQIYAVASGRRRDASQGGGGVHSGAMGDDDNAARRPSGGRAAGWMICKAHPG
jgi:hypothetical protein